MDMMELSSSQEPHLLGVSSQTSLDQSLEANSATTSANTIHKPLHHEEPQETDAAEDATIDAFDLSVHPKETVRRIFGVKDALRQPFTQHSDENVEHYTMRLVRAVRSSDTKELRQIMLNNDDDREDVSLEACNNQGESLLHLACRRSNVDTLRLLVLEAGVDVHVRDDMGRSVLHDLFWRPEVAAEHLRLLLSVMDPSFLLLEDSRGHTPLDYSRQENWKEWNAFFLQSKALLHKRGQHNDPAAGD